MNKNFWNGKKVLITGGAGFIGSHLAEKLIKRDAKVTILDNLQSGTLKNLQGIKKEVNLIVGDCSDVNVAFKACKGKDVVMNLAARVGGIDYNRTHQATMMHDNLQIATVLLEAARKADADRFLVVSSACVYPHDASIPTPESEGFLGEPEPTNGGYGWAKRMAERLGMYYASQYGMNIGIVRPYNCYGPRDHFDPQNSHVIAAIIKRLFDRDDPLIVWGTGRQTRAFLYVEDLAEGLILAIEKYPKADPINLGTNEEITIKSLVEKIVKIAGLTPKIKFDLSKPDGSPRRNSLNQKAEEKIGFFAKTSLDEGLQKTIEWYKRR